MPEKLPTGTEISISRRSLPADYQMPIMGMSTDHYALGFLLSGDRRTITPRQTYDAHAGDVSMMAPFLYHRTVSLSDAPYESYLVKFTAKAAEPLTQLMGPSFLDELTERKIHHLPPAAGQRLCAMLEEMRLVYEKSPPYAEAVLQGMLPRILTLVQEESVGEGAEYFPSRLSAPVIDMLARMEECCGSELTLDSLAREMGYSPAHLSRLFKTQLGCGFSQYLTRMRLRRACFLLSETDQSIGSIALACGFCNGDYFATRFRAGMGLPPGDFRRQARQHIPQGGSQP